MPRRKLEPLGTKLENPDIGNIPDPEKLIKESGTRSLELDQAVPIPEQVTARSELLQQELSSKNSNKSIILPMRQKVKIQKPKKIPKIEPLRNHYSDSYSELSSDSYVPPKKIKKKIIKKTAKKTKKQNMMHYLMLGSLGVATLYLLK
jgi:hypothetical protein